MFPFDPLNRLRRVNEGTCPSCCLTVHVGEEKCPHCFRVFSIEDLGKIQKGAEKYKRSMHTAGVISVAIFVGYILVSFVVSYYI